MALARIVLFSLFLILAIPSKAQLNSLNEGSVEILGHSLGGGFTYRRTLDMSHYNEWHGLLSTGITSGMYSSYVGLGYRRMFYIKSMDYFLEVQVLGGYNQLYGLRREKADVNAIQSGLSYGAHLNIGHITIDNYSVRITTGYHFFQNQYGQFILGMQVGRFFD